MSTLWDLMRGLVGRKPAQPEAWAGVKPQRPQARAREGVPAAARRQAPRAVRQAAEPMQAKYDAVTKAMLEKYGVRVRRWRTAMSGIAWEVRYRDGTSARLIESPKPKGPMSAAVFLHEIGHHVIGLGAYRPRCLEEFHAWRFSLEQMDANGLNVTEAVRRRIHASLHYAVGKARRRGLQELPPELEPFVQPPPRSPRRGGGVEKRK
ncbi:MAG: hypothetical protein ACKVW3_04190 [Phycisphaerales bacterium]